MMGVLAKYDKLPQSDDLTEDEAFKEVVTRQKYRSRIHIWRIATALATAIAAAALFAWFHLYYFRVFIPPVKTHCGRSIAEARANGCVFEVLSGAWMPPQCLDNELNDEFNALGWQYWADDQRHVEIPMHELQLREGEEGVYYTTQGWHITHCAYQWRKLHRAWQTGRAVELGDHALGDINHTLHCGSLYPDMVPFDDINTRIVVEFFSC